MARTAANAPTLGFVSAVATLDIYPLSLHDALPISPRPAAFAGASRGICRTPTCFSLGPARSSISSPARSEEHTSELQSLRHLVCRLLLGKKNTTKSPTCSRRQPS